jgi:hypothetical protein
MSETAQILIAALFLVIVFILTRLGIAWKMGQTAARILQDLESRQAFDPMSAVPLPYAKPPVLRIGLRDYPSKTLEHLVTEGAIGKTEDKRYYLVKRLPKQPV